MSTVTDKSEQLLPGNEEENERYAWFRLGEHEWQRDEKLDLRTELDSYEKSVYDLTSLSLYCDAMRVRAHDEYPTEYHFPDSFRVLNIFARDFLTVLGDVTRLVFKGSGKFEDREIRIHCGTMPKNLLVGFGSNTPSDLWAIGHDEKSCPEILSGQTPTHRHITLPAPTPIMTPSTEIRLAAAGGEDDMTKRAIDEANKYTDSASPVPRSINEFIGRRILLTADGKGSCELIKDIPLAEVGMFLPADVLAFGREMRKPEFFHDMLKQLFLLASQDILRANSNVELSMSRLKFIIRSSIRLPALAGLAADAQKLLDRLEIPLRAPLMQRDGSARYYVPHLTFLQLLKNSGNDMERLRAATTELARIDEGMLLDEKFAAMFKAIMGGLSLALEGYTDSQGAYNTASAAMTDAEGKRRDMAAAVAASESAMEVFRKGVDDWTKKKKEEAKKELIFAVLELVVGVGIAIATYGAGTPMCVGQLKKAQDAVAKGLSTWDKIKSALGKLIKLAADILPKLWNAWKQQKIVMERLMKVSKDKFDDDAASKHAREALEAAGGYANGGLADNAATRHVDYLGIMAGWDEFDIEVDGMFKDFESIFGSERPDGMTEYWIYMKKQAVRGRTVLQSMRNVQEATQHYIRQKTEEDTRAARMKTLQGLANQALNADLDRQVRLQILRWRLGQEISSLKRCVFVRSHQVLLALIYASNQDFLVHDILKSHPIQANSDVKLFMDCTGSARSRYEEMSRLPQRMNPEITPLNAPKCFDVDWRSLLQLDKVLRFNFDPNNVPGMGGLGRVRVQEMSAKFVGPAFANNPPVLRWELGPKLVDRTKDGRTVLYYMPPVSLLQVKEKDQWIVDGAEYAFSLPSLFCEGSLTFLDPSAKSKTTADLSGVTDFTLSFICRTTT